VISLDQIPGWAADDHAAAFAVFRASATAIARGLAPTRAGTPPGEALVAVARSAVEAGALDGARARAFLERHFVAHPRREGFMTGYFEPGFEGRLAPDEQFRHPLRRPPPSLEGLPERSAIEEGALGADAPPFVWFRDALEPFLIQVQGSARVALPDGETLRLAYAGRNGWPYTSIGKALVAGGHVPADGVDIPAIRRVFAEDPELARATLRLNQSYVFFEPRGVLDPNEGPIGAQGLPLVPDRSIAIDRAIHAYGTLVWLDGVRPAASGGDAPFAGLRAAQDTGSAILGDTRVDEFRGWGADAEDTAGRTRHAIGFTLLEPRP
jgi:membrane-bound lytic murein transglycosylase A